MTAPLTGIRVLEATNWMAAPSAGAIMADMGADVIKIEPLTGDAVRGLIRQPKVDGPAQEIDYSFTVDNRGKRSIAVAINTPEGRDVIHRLIPTADIFLSNLLLQRQLRFGLDEATLQELKPDLIHATLSGYGPTGPDKDRPGFDVTTFFGRGAVTDAMTDPGSVAPNPRPAQGDHAAGLALLASILGALRLRDQTGEGQSVNVSLFATAAWTMASDLSAPLIDGRNPTKLDRRHRITPLSNRFPCSDGRWIILNMPEPHWWPRFVETIERPDLLTDPRFITFKDRFDNMPELIDLLDEVFATKTMVEWGECFDEHGMIWGPAATMVELINDPQAEAVGMFPMLEHPLGPFRTVASPIGIAGADVAPRGPAPGVGDHTMEVLTSAGFTTDEVVELIEKGVLGR